MESKSGAKLLLHEKKSPIEREKVKAVDAKEQSFWILLESALDDILTPAETSNFISKMKKVRSHRATALVFGTANGNWRQERIHFSSLSFVVSKCSAAIIILCSFVSSLIGCIAGHERCTWLVESGGPGRRGQLNSVIIIVRTCCTVTELCQAVQHMRGGC